jgi:hypothetical protein
MTVRAEDTEVLQPVVHGISVHVVEHERQRRTKPLRQATQFAHRREEALTDQTLPKTG